MINFLVINNLSLLPTDYFKFIVQFDSQMEADIWFIENGFNTEQVPFYKDELECAPVNELIAKSVLTFAKNSNIKHFTLIESEHYRVLCFTEKERNKFTAQRIEGAVQENLEFTDVETSFIYGFVNA